MTSSSSILIFGLQGSSSVFSAATAQATRRHVEQNSSLCRTILDEATKALLADAPALGLPVADLFAKTGDILGPHSTEINHNPLFQAFFISLHQFIAVAADFENSGRSFEAWVGDVDETVGFCSGLLPAAVLASASTKEEFLGACTQALRASLWIANAAAPLTPSQSNTLVIAGIKRAELEIALSKDEDSVALSAILNETSYACTGLHLDQLRSRLPQDTHTQYASVNGWYHRGPAHEHLIAAVMESLRVRRVTFDPVLQRPLRLSSDGQRLPVASSALEPILRHMLLLPIDFPQTAKALLAEHHGSLPSAHIFIKSFGPAPEPFLNDLKSQGLFDTLASLEDLSPFSLTEPIADTDIAIVGKAFDFPGAHNDEELISLLSSRICTVSEIPSTRFDVNQFVSSESDASNEKSNRKMATRFGCFVDDIASFDFSFFNISPREVKSMDPQQRLLLTAAKRALEDAGYTPDSTPTFRRDSFGCYVGLATGDYTDNLRNDIDVFYSPGTLRAFHAGKLSYFCKFSGPSMVIDTACSSSLVSISQACRALVAGDCTAAIAGGVNTISSPDMYLGLSKAHFLSETGCCKPFDASADGYCRGEACALVVLKKLSDAIAEGDVIHGVIKGISINNSGNSSSITHPHAGTQASLMRQVIETSGVDASTINVVEAHGTGTQAGDSGEANSLSQTLRGADGLSSQRKTFIGSIKGNIGHTEAASGVAALVKLLVMLQQRSILPQASFNTLNPSIKDLFASANFTVPLATEPWPQVSRRVPRRALLNNFGASGSNATLIVQEHMVSSKQSPPVNKARSMYMFNLSATEPDRLKELIELYKAYVQKKQKEATIADFCYGATARRQLYKYGQLVCCGSTSDLISQLEALSSQAPTPWRRHAAAAKTIFLFSGQGGLYEGMGWELWGTDPEFRKIFQHCDDIVKHLGIPSLMLYFDPTRTAEYESLSPGLRLAVSHCTCIALQYGLAKLIQSWGVVPARVIGHSLGEYAALAVSGAITIDDALMVAAERGLALGQTCQLGGSAMLAVNIAADAAEKIVEENSLSSTISVACSNSKVDTVVSGDAKDLKTLETFFRSAGIKCKVLPIPLGFHSPALEPALPFIAAAEKRVRFSEPTIAVDSTLLGRRAAAADLGESYLTRQAREPVRFLEAMDSAIDSLAGQRVNFVEIGPRVTLLPLVRNIVPPEIDASATCSLHHNKTPWESLTLLAKTFMEQGHDLDMRQFFSGTGAVYKPLPEHPLRPRTENVYVPYTEAVHHAEITPARPLASKLLRSAIKSAETLGQWIFSTSTHTLGPLIAGHEVGNVAICPASVYHEMCLEGLSHLAGAEGIEMSHGVTAEKLQFTHPLMNKPGSIDEPVRLVLTPLQGAQSQVEVYSAAVFSGQDTEHFAAQLTLKKDSTHSTRWRKQALAATRSIKALHQTEDEDTSSFPRNILYETVFSRVVKYSRPYQTLSRFKVSSATLEGAGLLQVPSEAKSTGYVANPVFYDTLLHAAGFVANCIVAGADDIYICSRVESIASKPDVDFDASYSVYTTLYANDGKSVLADSIALDAQGQIVAEIEAMEFKKLNLATFRRFLGHSASEPMPVVSQVRIESKSVLPGSTHATSSIAPAQKDLTPPASGTSTPNLDIHALIGEAMSIVSGFATSELDFNAPLDSMGVDSLMQIEFEAYLKKRLPLGDIDRHSLFDANSLGQLEKALELTLRPNPGKLVGPRSQCTEICKTLQLLHKADEDRTPLVMIHDGSGQISSYKRLKGLQRSCWGISDPSLGEEEPLFGSIQEMAEHYVDQILGEGFPGVMVGGWSFGGVVALEVARLLQGSTCRCEALVLVDSPYPVGHQAMPRSVVSALMQLNGSRLPERQRLEIMANFERSAAMLERYRLGSSIELDCMSVVLRSEDVFDTQAHGGLSYGFLCSQDERQNNFTQWSHLLHGKVLIDTIPGNHFEPFMATNVDGTQRALRKALDQLEGSG